MHSRLYHFFKPTPVKYENDSPLFNTLPQEMISEIIYHLDIVSASKFSQTCHRFQERVANSRLKKYGSYQAYVALIKKFQKRLAEIKPSLILKLIAEYKTPLSCIIAVLSIPNSLYLLENMINLTTNYSSAGLFCLAIGLVFVKNQIQPLNERLNKIKSDNQKAITIENSISYLMAP